jgi:hypothetical protein
MARIVTSSYRLKARKKRPGVHSKNGTSKNKNSKNYVKAYRGQGR